MNIEQIARRSVATIDADTEAMNTQLAEATAAAGRIPAMKEALARLTTATLCDPTRQPDLYAANAALSAAEALAASAPGIRTRLTALASEKSQVLAEQRTERIRTATNRLNAAENAYIEASKQAVRAYRAYVNEYFRAGEVRPNHGSPLGAPGFTFFMQPGYVGEPSQITASDLLYWEQQERDGEAA